MKVAFLITGNDVGFELFEFLDPSTKAQEAASRSVEGEYLRGGYFHICVTAPNPDGVADEVCKDGGSRVGETIPQYDGDVALYLRDPWGNMVELTTASFQQTHANRDP